jgi:hypothetical protein
MSPFTFRRVRWMLLAACAVAGPAPGAVRIDVAPPLPDTGTRLRVSIEGEWPDACPPELKSARIEAQTIVLTSEVPATRCDGPPTAYRLESDRLAESRLKLTRNGIFRVRHEVRRGSSGIPELHGFRLLQAGNALNAGFVPETGFWWPERGGEFDRAGPGLGVQMEAQATTLSLSAFGYDAQGAAAWHIGAGPIIGQTAQIELSRLSGGAGPFEPYRAPASVEPVGSVHVEILSPSRVTLWFVRLAGRGTELTAEPVSMVRFRFAQEPAEAWLGRWVVLAESDDAFATRRIDFTAIERDADEFTLVDAEARHRLACRLAPTQPNTPPLSCRLSMSDEPKGTVEFTDVALGELRGWNGGGQRIVALKLKR